MVQLIDIKVIFYFQICLTEIKEQKLNFLTDFALAQDRTHKFITNY